MSKPSLREAKITERDCVRCNRVLPLEKLKTNASCTAGHQRLCLECDSKRQRNRYAANPTAISNKVQAYRNTPQGKATLYKINLKQLAKNPEKFKARRAVAYAVKTGKLNKPQHCSTCEKTGRIEGHHQDYSKPLEVKWLCSYCHKVEHGVII